MLTLISSEEAATVWNVVLRALQLFVDHGVSAKLNNNYLLVETLQPRQ